MKKTKIIKDKALNTRVCSELLGECLERSGLNASQLINTLLFEYASGSINLCKNSQKIKLSKPASNT
jgi:hypothetical protein